VADVFRPRVIFRPRFISSYQPSTRPFWILMVVVVVIASFSIGPLYSVYLRKFFKDREREDLLLGDELAGTTVDKIHENEQFENSRVLRIIASLVLFVLTLAIPIGLTILLTWFGSPEELRVEADDNVRTALSFACAGVVAITNVGWEFVCTALTKLQKHQTWSQFRKWNAFMLVTFKVLNVMTLYTVRYLVDRKRTRCIATTLGLQFLSFILIDLILLNLHQIFTPKIMACIQKKSIDASEHGDDAARPDFDLAQEYLELIYRQFVVYIGIPVFPMIAAFAFLLSIIEFYVDKYRLFCMCKKPVRADGSMRPLLLFFLLFISVMSFFAYPTGPMYFAAGPQGMATICFPCAQFTSNVGGEWAHIYEKCDCPFSGWRQVACTHSLRLRLPSPSFRHQRDGGPVRLRRRQQLVAEERELAVLCVQAVHHVRLPRSGAAWRGSREILVRQPGR